MKLKKNNWIHLAVLTLMYLAMVLAITGFKYAYGSDLDWSAQHFAIPDNFRREFYRTGNLFPSFLFNIGAGENIYDLSYYGLFSPIILLSYLFPFVPMYIYIQAVSVLGVIVSIFLFYRWTLRKFDSRTAFVLTVLFEFSTSFSLHSHRHIMFVSYMPFLLLAFNAVEDYFLGRRKYMLVIYTFLCIMCCYFFGVSACAAIAVYGVYEYLRTTPEVTLRDLWKKGSHFAGRIITAVMLSGILLLPTLYCLLSGRDAGNSSIELSSLFPKPDISFFCYDTYGMGLTLTALIAVVSAVVSKNKKHIRFLGITMLALLMLPVFVFALNGTLYIDSKVLIPFMPLCLLLVGRMSEQIQDRSFSWKLTFPVTALLAGSFVLFVSANQLVKRIMLIDVIALAVVIAVYLFAKKRIVIQTGVMTIAVIAGFVANYNDELTELSKLEHLYGSDMYSVMQTVEDDPDVVRTANLIERCDTPNTVYNNSHLTSTIYSSVHNKNYNRFYFEGIYNENEFRNPALTTQSQSIIHQLYMGEKYLLSDGRTKPSSLYEPAAQKGDITLYKCDAAMPIAYCSSDLLNEKAYLDIKYPYCLDALMSRTVVSQGGSDSFESDRITPTDAPVIKDIDGITESSDGYNVRLQKTISFDVALKKPVASDEILLISFDVDNDLRDKGLSAGDAKVFIDGIKNNLTDPGWKYYNNNTTFEYVVSPHDNVPVTELKMKFMKGNYDIRNIRCYIMKLSQRENIDRFVFDKEKTKGDDIAGSIDVKKDGYFRVSVPYSEGFTAFVDGEKAEVECVDTAFIGFPLSEGHHDIKITFTAPLKKEGLLMSAGGVVVLAVLIVFECLCKKKNEKQEVK